MKMLSLAAQNSNSKLYWVLYCCLKASQCIKAVFAYHADILRAVCYQTNAIDTHSMFWREIMHHCFSVYEVTGLKCDAHLFLWLTWNGLTLPEMYGCLVAKSRHRRCLSLSILRWNFILLHMIQLVVAINVKSNHLQYGHDHGGFHLNHTIDCPKNVSVAILHPKEGALCDGWGGEEYLYACMFCSPWLAGNLRLLPQRRLG